MKSQRSSKLGVPGRRMVMMRFSLKTKEVSVMDNKDLKISNNQKSYSSSGGLFFVTKIYCYNNQNLIASCVHSCWSLKKPAYACENSASSGSTLYICSWNLAICTLIVIKKATLHRNWSMSATPHSVLPTSAQSYRVFAKRLAVFMRISCRARSSDPLS